MNLDSTFGQRVEIPQDCAQYQKVRKLMHALGMNEFNRRVASGYPRAIGIAFWANLAVEYSVLHHDEFYDRIKQNTAEKRGNELADARWWKVAPWRMVGKVKDIDPLSKQWTLTNGYAPNAAFVDSPLLKSILEPQTKLA